MKKLKFILLISGFVLFCVFSLNALADEELGDVANPGDPISVEPNPDRPPQPPIDPRLEPKVVIKPDEKLKVKAGTDMETAPCVLTGPTAVLDENS